MYIAHIRESDSLEQNVQQYIMGTAERARRAWAWIKLHAKYPRNRRIASRLWGYFQPVRGLSLFHFVKTNFADVIAFRNGFT